MFQKMVDDLLKQAQEAEEQGNKKLAQELLAKAQYKEELLNKVKEVAKKNREGTAKKEVDDWDKYRR